MGIQRNLKKKLKKTRKPAFTVQISRVIHMVIIGGKQKLCWMKSMSGLVLEWKYLNLLGFLETTRK